MKPLSFAHSKIVFDEASPICGPFDIKKYRMLEKPLADLDNIHIKRMVWYKASSALGTVGLQIAAAYWLDQRPGSLQMTMQSDDDADDWMKTRGKKWMLRIPGIRDTMSSDKHAVTNSLWQWPYQFLKVTGPGENAQQSKQVTRLITDESHVTAFYEGYLASLEERMSKRWNRMALHVTTGADAGKEVDRFYHLGSQNEHHLCCPKCHRLIWPLWREESREHYNGHEVFHFDIESEDSRIELICPHCSATFQDDSRTRYALHEGSDYVAMNPTALRENQSYRWTTFSAHWIPWAEALAKYREALTAWALGDLAPMENFEKKRLCRSYKGLPPDTDAGAAGNFEVGKGFSIIEGIRRFAAIDFQEGRAGEGSHFWMLADEFKANGDSRRLDYRKLNTWGDVRATQLEFDVADWNTFCDAGHRDKEVYANCAQFHWYAMLATDDSVFHHLKTINKGEPKQIVAEPYYSQTKPQNSTIGVVNKLKEMRGVGRLPAGYCWSRMWSKPNVGFLLLRLKGGRLPFEYGIPAGLNPEFGKQLAGYVETMDLIKKTNVKVPILRKVRESEHAFGCACTTLIGAMISKYFPLANLETEKAA